MDKEMFNELFKDVVVNGHYPLEKLHEMDWYIRSLNDKIDNLQQENQQLKEQNEKEFADYTKFKQKQYDEYLDEINKLIKEKIMIKKISSDWEQTCIKLEQQLDLYRSVISEITKFVDERMYYLKGINLTNYELERISKILNKANKGSDNDE